MQTKTELRTLEENLDYYIIPLHTIHMNAERCIERVENIGVLMLNHPAGSPLQKWRFIKVTDVSSLVIASDNPQWCLTHPGIYEGPIWMSQRSELPTDNQLWYVRETREMHQDSRFSPMNFTFLTHRQINDPTTQGLVWSCMGVAKRVRIRPQHLLEWKLKNANQDFSHGNQVFEIRRA